MSQHRRRNTANNRKQRRVLTGTAVVAVAALGVGLGLWAAQDDDGPADAGQESAAASPSPTPTPTRSYPLSKAPEVIPAVRDHTAARGPGWRPAHGDRVVVSDADLADEGKLIAGELGLTYAGDKDDVKAGDVRLSLGDDDSAGAESYTMTVRGGRVDISGPSDAGVFYGTRTLKQEVHGGGTAPEGVVKDQPAKPVRNFTLDIARKPFTADWIEARVKEIGDLKYNELGLHFSDDQAFRIESSSHPEIVSKDHLTKAQVKKIVDLATSRHITVVPEIDSPGHLGAVIAAHPDLQLRNAQGVATKGAVDISKPAAADLVDDLLNEYADVFPGDKWHLGGDEYQALTVSNPETSYPQLAAAAREAYGSGGTVSDLTTAWMNDRADTVAAHDRKIRAWNDGFYKSATNVTPDEDLQVAYWTGKEIGARQPTEYLSTGRDLINYNDEFLYYVLGQPNTFVYPTGQRIYEKWTPLVVRGTTPVPSKYNDQILGASFSVWCDLPNAQTQAQVASGIRLPLRATVQKLWDPGTPALTWTQFKSLADKVG